MKVICERTGVFIVKAGKSLELSVGENEVDKEQAENLIARGIVKDANAKPKSTGKESQDKSEGKGSDKKSGDKE